MYELLPSFVLGFHGCDEVVAEQVFAGEVALRASQNEYDWLGHGIYFWENNPQRAVDYARVRKHRRGHATQEPARPAVIGAVIDLGRCLNLLDAESLLVVKTNYHNLLEPMRESGTRMPRNRRPRGSDEWLLRPLDCAVIETVHRVRDRDALAPFDSVRGVFVEGAPLYPGAGFHERNHIQICVRSLRCIKGYFRVLSEPTSDASPA